MKAFVASVLLLAGSTAMASGFDFDRLANQSEKTMRACKEGSVQTFPNDGQCRYGWSRTTVKKCVNGRYVTIRSYCERD